MTECNLYRDLHLLFNAIPRIRFPYTKERTAEEKNGIYIMYEKGQHYHGMDRIVRIGSHTGQDRLYQRLDDHFIHHRKSVFRKHLGRCFLSKKGREDYLPIWNCNIVTKEERKKTLPLIDWELENELEATISTYLRKNFSFVIIPEIIDPIKRQRLETGIIATLAQSEERKSSKNWLGKWHPNEKIHSSKLWNINHLTSPTLNQQEMLDLNKEVSKMNGNKSKGLKNE